MIQFLNNLQAFTEAQNMDVFATVDPGYNTGIAIWDVRYLEAKHRPYTEYFVVPGIIKQKADKLSSAWVNFEYFLHTNKTVEVVYIEDTALWQESLTSMVSGSSGDLLTLSQLIGGYCRICMEHERTFKFVPAQQWKGQMNKQAVARRIERETGWTYPNSHVTDAVGMGISMINNWRVTK